MRRNGPEDQVVDMEEVLARLADSGDERIVVAEYDGEFAGAVHLQATTMSALNLEPVVRALSPHVLPRFRRHGIGSALMDAAVTWAEDLGVSHVATAAVAGSRDANRFMARIALGPYAVLRVATTHAVRTRLGAQRRPARSTTGGRQLDPGARRAPLAATLAGRRGELSPASYLTSLTRCRAADDPNVRCDRLLSC